MGGEPNHLESWRTRRLLIPSCSPQILEGTSQSIPISRLSLEAFNTPLTSSSTSPRPYALRIGIDASLWIFHANRQSSQAGLNPFLRTLFFKTLKLLQHPILPLFVFDGPFKPGMKRNQKVAGMFGTTDQASKRFKGLLDDMGIEYWTVSPQRTSDGSICICFLSDRIVILKMIFNRYHS